MFKALIWLFTNALFSKRIFTLGNTALSSLMGFRQNWRKPDSPDFQRIRICQFCLSSNLKSLFCSPKTHVVRGRLLPFSHYVIEHVFYFYRFLKIKNSLLPAVQNLTTRISLSYYGNRTGQTVMLFFLHPKW